MTAAGEIVDIFQNLFRAVGGESSLDRIEEIVRGSSQELRDVYRRGLSDALDCSLRELGISQSGSLRELRDLTCYDRSMPGYIGAYLMWIWIHKLHMNPADLENVAQAMIEGSVGYWLVDSHLDERKLGPEAAVVGSFIIRRHEHRLAAVFGHERTWPVLKKYSDLYASVEYIEKSSLWKSCPFSWEDAWRIGWKAAPIIAIAHLLLELAGKPAAEANVVAKCLCMLSATLQLDDDAADASIDLKNGFETLAASGFYEWNQGREISASVFAEFFDQDRYVRHFETVLELFDAAIRGLEGADEPVFVMIAEQMKNQRLRRIEFRKPDLRESAETHE